MWHKNTDVHQITVAGINPHDVAVKLQEAESPFHDPVVYPSVAQHIISSENQLVGGIVEVWTPEHLTPEQEAYLKQCPHVIDIRHVYP